MITELNKSHSLFYFKYENNAFSKDFILYSKNDSTPGNEYYTEGSDIKIDTIHIQGANHISAIRYADTILESMSRSLRTAQSWDIGNTFDHFGFVDQDGVAVSYDYLQEGIVMTKDTIPYKLNPSNVSIDNLLFTQFGGTMGQQSYLQINISGTVTSGRDTSSFSFQTSVSKRRMDDILPI